MAVDGTVSDVGAALRRPSLYETQMFCPAGGEGSGIAHVSRARDRPYMNAAAGRLPLWVCVAMPLGGRWISVKTLAFLPKDGRGRSPIGSDVQGVSQGERPLPTSLRSATFP